MSRIIAFLQNSPLSCKRNSERMSRALDEPLPPIERAFAVIHHAWCFNCYRMFKRMRMMDRWLSIYSKHIQENGIAEESFRLSDVSKARIKLEISRRSF